jgi:hypothetical protein
VFFYYAKAIAPAPSFCVNVVQTKSCSNLALFHLQQVQIYLYTSNCVKQTTNATTGAEITYNSTQEVSQVCITGATPGESYIIGIKYDAKSIVGSQGNTGACTYSFVSQTIVGNTTTTVPCSQGTLQVVQGCTAARMDGSTYITGGDDISMNAYPNPFSSQTTIEFTLHQPSSQTSVEVYSYTGALVGVLYNGNAEEGVTYKAVLDAGNLAPGIYFYRVTTDEGYYVNKLILTK